MSTDGGSDGNTPRFRVVDPRRSRSAMYGDLDRTSIEAFERWASNKPPLHWDVEPGPVAEYVPPLLGPCPVPPAPILLNGYLYGGAM